jgi:hypothetical protein
MGIITAHRLLKIFHLNLQMPILINDHDERTTIYVVSSCTQLGLQPVPTREAYYAQQVGLPITPLVGLICL